MHSKTDHIIEIFNKETRIFLILQIFIILSSLIINLF